MGYLPYQLVQDFVHQQYVLDFGTKTVCIYIIYIYTVGCNNIYVINPQKVFSLLGLQLLRFEAANHLPSGVL